MINIPLVDLKAQYCAYKDEFDAALEHCVTSSSFIGGADHEAFAREFAEFCGGGHVALYGDAACFSFYPGKNLGAWGDGGAVFSRNQALIERIQMRANHGRTAKYEHEFIGINSRLDGLQAAILRVKLRHLAEWNQKRREVAGWYDELLGALDSVQPPTVADGAEHVFHLYVVRVDDRDRVLDLLREQGIGAGVHYPIPLHEQPVYAHLGIAPEALPVTHTLARRVLSLPIYPEMTLEQVEAIVALLREHL
jgi:dTDP-4-amino-4,6-dideoxygalactose transaminase